MDAVNGLLDQVTGWVDKGVTIVTGYATAYPKVILVLVGGLIAAKIFKIKIGK